MSARGRQYRVKSIEMLARAEAAADQSQWEAAKAFAAIAEAFAQLSVAEEMGDY